MLFNSYIFIFAFLPVALTGWWALRRHTSARLIFLTLMSYVFYGYWDWRFVSLMLVSTVVDYVAGKVISSTDDPKLRKRWLIASMVANLGLLGFFKYCGFFLSSVAATCSALGCEQAIPTLNVVLPVGISFYTFQSMSYTIDLYRGVVQPARSFLHFALYVSMYPQLVAGPIVRYSYIEDQLIALRGKLTAAQVWQGIYFFVWGLMEKILVADAVAEYADTYLARHATLTVMDGWAAMLAYAYQILFDFSGYSAMAVGLGLMLGFNFPQNFNSPYKAPNPSDFWRRWHMTLSEWLRDYLYIPLGGSRGGMVRTLRNLVITMFLGGLWHGAAWTFVAWGLFHGALLAGYHSLHHLKLWPTNKAVARAITFVAVLIGWVLFRCNDWAMVGSVFQAMFGLRGFEIVDLPTKLVALLLMCFAWTNWGPNAWDLRMTPSRGQAIFLAVLALACVLLMGRPSPFLYFQF